MKLQGAKQELRHQEVIAGRGGEVMAKHEEDSVGGTEM